MARTRRPMIEMTGTVADLLQGDYVDQVGGQGFKEYRVGAIVHRIEHVAAHTGTTDLAKLVPGTVDVTYNVQAATYVEFLGMGGMSLSSKAPVKFRRFAD